MQFFFPFGLIFFCVYLWFTRFFIVKMFILTKFDDSWFFLYNIFFLCCLFMERWEEVYPILCKLKERRCKYQRKIRIHALIYWTSEAIRIHPVILEGTPILNTRGKALTKSDPSWLFEYVYIGVLCICGPYIWLPKCCHTFSFFLTVLRLPIPNEKISEGSENSRHRLLCVPFVGIFIKRLARASRRAFWINEKTI